MNQGRIISVTKLRQILSLIFINYSYSSIVKKCKIAKSTIEKYKKILSKSEIRCLDDIIHATDEELVNLVFGNKAKLEKRAYKSFIKIIKKIPSIYKKDYLKIDAEKYLEKLLSDPFIYISDLYKDYVNDAIVQNKSNYKSTTFRKVIKEELLKIKIKKISMHRQHKYGDELELDWCGQTIKILSDEGKIKKYYVLVLTWATSYYCFATLVEDLTTANAVNGVREGLKYFGVKPNILLVDNAKALVIKHKFGHEALINDSFNNFSKKCSIIVNANNPGRANEKSAVEHSVRMIQERVLHKLGKNLSLENAKIQLQSLTNKYINDAPFRMSQTITRTYLFENFEKKASRKVFNIPEYCTFISNRKVSKEYHIKVLGNYYSAPSEYTGSFVDVEVTDKVVKIFHQNKEIAVHCVEKEEQGKYITNPKHMPENHRSILYKDCLFSDPKHTFLLVRGLSHEVLAFCLVFFNSKHSFSEIRKACAYVIKRYKQIENEKDRINFNVALKNLLLREEEIEKINTYTFDEELKLVSTFN